MRPLTYKKRLTIHGNDEFLSSVKKAADAAGLSINEYAKNGLEKLVKGEIIAKGQLLQGEDSDQCIQPLADYKKPEVCPFKKQYPELKKANNALALQESFCIKCPFYRKDMEVFKANLKRQMQQNKPAAAPKPAPVAKAVLKFTIKCTGKKDDGSPCESSWDSEYYEDHNEPLWDMRHSIAAHKRGVHGKDYLERSEDPFLVQQQMQQEMQAP